MEVKNNLGEKNQRPYRKILLISGIFILAVLLLFVILSPKVETTENNDKHGNITSVYSQSRTEENNLLSLAKLGFPINVKDIEKEPTFEDLLAYGEIIYGEKLDYSNKEISTKNYVNMLIKAVSKYDFKFYPNYFKEYLDKDLTYGLVADITYKVLAMVKAENNETISLADELVKKGVLNEVNAILADLPVEANDSQTYINYFVKDILETTQPFNYTEKNKRIMAFMMDDYDTPFVLVNKEHLLPSTFVPPLVTEEELSLPRILPNSHMRPIAYENLEKLFAGALDDNVKLICRSGYRSYQTQVGLYGNGSNPYKAKPGESEHQSGLCIDVVGPNTQLSDDYINSPAGKWLKSQSYKYGFIVRYAPDKEDITKYPAEWWHIRYCGKTIAYECYTKNYAYEEFYDLVHE